MPLLGNEIRYRAAWLDARAPLATRSGGRRDQTASRELLERVLAGDAGEPRDRSAASRDHDVGTVLDAIEMLAEAIVEIPHADLVGALM